MSDELRVAMRGWSQEKIVRMIDKYSPFSDEEFAELIAKACATDLRREQEQLAERFVESFTQARVSTTYAGGSGAASPPHLRASRTRRR
jgi:hypothetical protein